MIQQPPVDEELAAEGEADAEAEEELMAQKKFPRTPLPWESFGSELDVEDEVVIENRPKVCYTFNYIHVHAAVDLNTTLKYHHTSL